MNNTLAARTVARNGRSAFTLVEMLVVIGIIVLLIAILLPTLSRSRDAARRTSCLSNLHQMSAAWLAYTDKWDGAIMGSDTTNQGASTTLKLPPEYAWINGTANAPATIENGALYPYLKTTKVYHCSADYSDHLTSYSMNGYFFSTVSAGLYSIPTITRRDQMTKPTETLLFIEEYDPRSGVNVNAFSIKRSAAVESSAQANSFIDAPAHFHKTGTVVSFADGHSEFWAFADQRTAELVNPNTSSPGNPDLARFRNAAGY